MSQQSFFYRGVDRVRPRHNGRIATAGVALVALIVIQSGLGQSVLRDAGVSRPTGPFVAIYLPNARALPSKVPASIVSRLPLP